MSRPLSRTTVRALRDRLVDLEILGDERESVAEAFAFLENATAQQVADALPVPLSTVHRELRAIRAQRPEQNV